MNSLSTLDSGSRMLKTEPEQKKSMTITILLATLAAAVVPFVLNRLWKSSRKVVYQGAAVPMTAGLEDLGQRTNTRYCWLATDSGEQYLTEVSVDRHAKIRSLSSPVTITVVKYLFGRAEVEAVTWPNETAPESVVSPSASSLLVTLAYFACGLGAMALGFKFQEAPTALLYMGASAFLLTLAGFAINLMTGPKPKRSELSGRMLGIPIGKGLVSLVVMFAISLAITIACFSSVSLFAFFPGIHAAFALGGVTAIWLKSRQAK